MECLYALQGVEFSRAPQLTCICLNWFGLKFKETGFIRFSTAGYPRHASVYGSAYRKLHSSTRRICFYQLLTLLTWDLAEKSHDFTVVTATK
mmetsp:Transcript_570/g.980  ORF Transcript_570/g.980 Transcript_570/m.980 type:complete len:92 (-) Transcript_570:417-692(-)